MALRLPILFLAAISAFAQQSRIAALAGSKDSLHQLSDSIESLSEQVSPAVVQIFSTSYTVGEEDSENSGTATMGLVTKQHSTGSGVILGADGYIVTNNHVDMRLGAPSPSGRRPSFHARPIGLGTACAQGALSRYAASRVSRRDVSRGAALDNRAGSGGTALCARSSPAWRLAEDSSNICQVPLCRM